MTNKQMQNVERIFLQTTFFNPNMLVPWYLMASYAYYIEDDPIMSDATFDNMAKNMLQTWSDIKHWHKYLISEEDLKAGTLLNRDFPLRVIGGLNAVRKEAGK